MSDKKIIPFNSWSRERIKQERKVCTSRKKHYDKDSRVVFVFEAQWWFIRNYLWDKEGADSPEELQRVINKIFRRVVEDREVFFVHFGDFTEKLK